MNFKVLSIFLATVATSSATTNNDTQGSTGLRGSAESINDRRLDEPTGSRDLFCGGGKVGNGFCPTGPDDVCSKWGYCGNTPAHYDNPAPGFFPRDDTETTCGGGDVGNGRCPDGEFCSKWGYCGKTKAHYDNPAPVANIQLFREAAFMSRMAYFVDYKKYEDGANCLDPNKDLLPFCEQHESGNDAVLITKYRDTCFVAFRGTKSLDYSLVNEMSQVEAWLNDSQQNLALPFVENEKECKIRGGFYQAYNTMKEFIWQNLPACKQTCENGGCDVVLTGHSQGGAAAVAASMDQKEEMQLLFNDPFVITMGAPPIAGTQEECENSINPDKHFRIVMGETSGNQLKCDPIAEHSRKKYTSPPINIRFGGVVRSKQFTIEDKNVQPTYQLGNVVLLVKDGKKDGKGLYQVGQGSGDVSCFDYDAGELQVLGTSDFVELKYLAGQIVGVKDDDEQPLHNVHTYNESFEDILGGSVRISDGLTENHVCTKNWQCKGDLICPNQKCVAPNSIGV